MSFGETEMAFFQSRSSTKSDHAALPTLNEQYAPAICRERVQNPEQVVNEAGQEGWHGRPVGEIDGVAVVCLSATSRCLVKKRDASFTELEMGSVF
jgi:hypothetical protein